MTVIDADDAEHPGEGAARQLALGQVARVQQQDGVAEVADRPVPVGENAA